MILQGLRTGRQFVGGDAFPGVFPGRIRDPFGALAKLSGQLFKFLSSLLLAGQDAEMLTEFTEVVPGLLGLASLEMRLGLSQLLDHGGPPLLGFGLADGGLQRLLQPVRGGRRLAQLGQPLDKPTIESRLSRVEKAKKPDGGWSLVSLGQWKRHNGETNDLDKAPADGYGTAMVILTLEGLGNDYQKKVAPWTREGREWLAKHQKISGRWFVRSPSNDKFHYMTHSGTAWAAYVLNQSMEQKHAPDAE